MGLRFWRRIKLAPGVTLNLSKSGGSLSFGPRGAKVTIGSRGTRATVGLPGTGLFYTEKLSRGKRRRKRRATGSTSEAVSAPKVSAAGRLSLGFFRRLVTPDDEEALVDGCRELVHGEEQKAFEFFRRSTSLVDGAYLAGFLALKRELFEEARQDFELAVKRHRELGSVVSKYGMEATISLPITEVLTAHVGPNLRGILLGLVEVHQREGRFGEALRCLERLRKIDPADLVISLSLADLLLDPDRPADGNGGSRRKQACKRVVGLTQGIQNETQLHAALLLMKGRALGGLGLFEAARDTLTSALRKKKNRPAELRKALRYERIGVYEQLGQAARVRTELEKLYAEDPTYEDVAVRLGL